MQQIKKNLIYQIQWNFVYKFLRKKAETAETGNDKNVYLQKCQMSSFPMSEFPIFPLPPLPSSPSPRREICENIFLDDARPALQIPLLEYFFSLILKSGPSKVQAEVGAEGGEGGRVAQITQAKFSICTIAGSIPDTGPGSQYLHTNMYCIYR